MSARPRLNPPFRADHVGSLLRPMPLIEARQAWMTGKLPREALREIEDRCVREVVALQERVGLQSITDGEMRRSSWRDLFFETVDGFGPAKLENAFNFTGDGGELLKSLPVPVVSGTLKRREPMTAGDFAALKPLTSRTAKAMLPSPSVNHMYAGDEMLKGSPYRDRRDYFADIAAIYRQEIAQLAALGCTYLQIDDVPMALLCDPKIRDIVRARGEDPDELITQYVAMHNDAVRERPPGMTLALHLCRGNSGRGLASGGYDAVAERLFVEFDVDTFFLEYDDSRSGGFEPLRFVPPERTVVLGLMSTKTAVLEPADGLRRRIEEAAKYCDLSRLCISPQCGFASVYLSTRLSIDQQERKLAHLVSVAESVWGRAGG